MPRRLLVVLFCIALSISLGGQTSPRTGQPDISQEALVFERPHDLVRFENDGTGVRDSAAAIRVQSQAAIQELGQLIFGYSSATENLQVDYVRVRKPGGQVVDTPPSSAQDFAPDVLREAPLYLGCRPSAWRRPGVAHHHADKAPRAG